MCLIRTINTFAYSQHLTSLGNQHWLIQGINPFPQEYQFLRNQCPSATHFSMLINNFYIDYLLLKGHQHYPSQRSLSRANMPPCSRAINTFLNNEMLWWFVTTPEILVLMVLELVLREGYVDGLLGIDCPGGRC